MYLSKNIVLKFKMIIKTLKIWENIWTEKKHCQEDSS